MVGGGLFAGVNGIGGLNVFQKASLHGIVGGALNSAAGGRFGEGFLGAFAASRLSC